ncbi:hypothetical protein EH220_01335 [bacterium]|nr:MAG: hypothetical protein EH220_01335 [bacterium]
MNRSRRRAELRIYLEIRVKRKNRSAEQGLSAEHLFHYEFQVGAQPGRNPLSRSVRSTVWKWSISGNLIREIIFETICLRMLLYHNVK